MSNAKWKDYPVGTKAYALMGGCWTKTDRGWRWGTNGGVFPTPGADALGDIVLPNEHDKNVWPYRDKPKEQPNDQR